MKKQLKIQASSISRIVKCPGSCNLESKLPDRLRHFAYKDAAEFGTLCPAGGEALLKSGVIHQPVISDVFKHARYEDIQFIGGTYAQIVRDNSPVKTKLYVEKKFRADILGIDCVAKSDAFFVTPRLIRKFDLKSGNYDYADSAKMQMEYAARLWCYINDKKDGRMIETYTVQPAYYSEARRVVASTPIKYNKQEFVDFIKSIKSRQKEFNPGEHCKMCAAILTCKAVKKLTEEFYEMAKKATKEDLDFVEIYQKKDAVIAFLDALDLHLKTVLESGKSIPGIFLDERSGHRRWLNVDEVIDKLAYLGNKIYEPKKLKTPAQVEKIAGKSNIEGLYDTPKLKKVAVRENMFESFSE